MRSTGVALERAIREPSSLTATSYRRRVRALAGVYLLLTAMAIVGEVLLFWRARFLIVLTQRSNVETLTLAFFVVFFAYVGVVAGRAAPGAVRVLFYALRGRESHTARRLGGPSGEDAQAALNVILEREDQPGEPFSIAIADDIGSMGAIRVDGARLRHEPAHRDGLSNLLAYFVHQVGELASARGLQEPLIVEWRKVHEEDTEKFLAQVEFARRLGRKLDCELWPRLKLNAEEVGELERRLSAVCGAVREETFLPHWEYAGSHKLPIVPEPLGLVSLERSETRVDPLASMTSIAVVVAAVVLLLVYLIVRPPWVPGS